MDEFSFNVVRYTSKILFGASPIPLNDLQVKVSDLFCMICKHMFSRLHHPMTDLVTKTIALHHALSFTFLI